MVGLNNENGPGTTNPGTADHRILTCADGTTINEHANTPRRHSSAPARMVIDMAALREALDCGFLAAVAIDLDKKDQARGWLDQGKVPAAMAFPAGSREAFGLAIVYGALIEAAAP